MGTNPAPYRCTVLLEMPADDGQATRPEDVVEQLSGMGVQMLEWHDEDLISQGQAPEPLPQWCPVCKHYHDNVGEQTDAGLITRACPLVSTDDPRYYGSAIYTGD